MKDYLEFEKPIGEVEAKIEKLKGKLDKDPSLLNEIMKLERKAVELREEVYSALNPWQRVQIARHPGRPSTQEYISMIFQDFTELHGDRLFSDDPAIIGGICRLGVRRIILIGTQKGKGVREKVFRNFGMPNPEGYRKALRLMKMAERFNMPVVTLIDTPGAYPGMGAEERGQAEAIARNLISMISLRVPIIAVIVGEGGSGGALALGVGDRVLMLENAVYSVISPEGCAAILWKDGSKAAEASEALKMTARDLIGLGIIDAIVPEPEGGAHRDPVLMAEKLKKSLEDHLANLDGIPVEDLSRLRHEKYRSMGVFGGGESV